MPRRRSNGTGTNSEQPRHSEGSALQFVQQGLSAPGGGLHLSLDQTLQLRLLWRRQRRGRVASRAPPRHQILQPLLLCRGEESIWPQILHNDQRFILYGNFTSLLHGSGLTGRAQPGLCQVCVNGRQTLRITQILSWRTIAERRCATTREMRSRNSHSCVACTCNSVNPEGTSTANLRRSQAAYASCG
jgi:hypothetical protein